MTSICSPDRLSSIIFIFIDDADEAARQALDWGLMELQEFLEDEELALGVKGEGPGKNPAENNISLVSKNRTTFHPPPSNLSIVYFPL